MNKKRVHEFLLKPELKKIHQASLEVLAETGIKITHPEIRRLLLEAGSKEGKDSVLLLQRDL